MPRRNENFGAGGTNKVHYGRCASGALISDMDFSRLTPPGLQNHQVCLWDNNKRDTAIQKISKIYCELYIRREFEINTSLFIKFQVFEYMVACNIFNIDRISKTNLRFAHSDNMWIL